MAARLEVALLGPIEVRRDGAVMPPAGVTQRVLLARFALASPTPGRPQRNRHR
jgi:hypothetical protein